MLKILLFENKYNSSISVGDGSAKPDDRKLRSISAEPDDGKCGSISAKSDNQPTNLWWPLYTSTD